jgi:hypothetical protein
MAKNGAYEADTLCLEYAILFQWDAVPAMQYRQANIFQTTPQYMCCSQKQMAHQLFSRNGPVAASPYKGMDQWQLTSPAKGEFVSKKCSNMF